MKLIKLTIVILLLATIVAGYYFYQSKQQNQQILSFWDQSNDSNSQKIDHSIWQEILENYVETEHESKVYLFDYSALDEEEVAELESYIQQLAGIDPRNYQRQEQKAYWINLYNALTVKLIIDHYPTDSITKLGETVAAFGPWDDDATIIAGQTLSLNNIEHQILRPIWQDPRIHFAVNCASYGCPNLQNKAFTSENIEELLNKSAKEYLNHPRGARLHGDTLILSSIFDWYAEDFGNSREEVLQTLSTYLPDPNAEELKSYQGEIKYEYDWGLNDLEAFE